MSNILCEEHDTRKAWYGHKPVLGHFIIFYCVAYAHVLDPKRKKVDDTKEKYVLLGVSEESKAFHIYNPLTNKVCISKSMVFDEIRSWNLGKPW